MTRITSIELHQQARAARNQVMAALVRAAWRWLTRGRQVAGSKLAREL